uniref:Retrotransposon gag protein n=1 Tax=Solanum tuberosum TaxID=4113 RepID=M1DIS6_SOLTU
MRFTQFSKYAPSIVADRWAKMSKFMSGVSDMVVKEYRKVMLVHDMGISRLMVHAQQIEEEKCNDRSRRLKRTRNDDGNSFYPRSGGRGCSRFQQKFFEQGFSNAPPRSHNERVSNPRP